MAAFSTILSTSEPTSVSSSTPSSLSALPLPASHPYFISNEDLSSLQLVTAPLSDANYHSWARSLRMGLQASNKLSLIDPLWTAWDQANVLVLGWLQRSVSPEIAQNVLWFDTAVEAWEDL
ncbi:unnamed protein product [Linum tenue]|uniref:Retrotransposon Copia-like N-terminal domain-containing protein n=1 Tax=Linum tenue TaxID=586396 RepID=A0AAV0LB55_9ROSI|nr:unnamed protein product [Linum tenue]